MASFVRRIARLRFEMPLAAALGLSGAFAASVAPLDGVMPDAGRWLLASAALIVLPPIAWASMRVRRARAVSPPETVAEEAMSEEPIPAVRMRRADRHPDAPVPQPIRAARDLGTPFMAIADDPVREPEPARFEEIVAEEPADAPVETALEATADEPLELTVVAPDPGVAETAEPIMSDLAASEPIETDTVEPAAVEPTAVEPVAVEPEPIAPEAIEPDRVDADEGPATARSESLAAMMDRLSRGVERRGGVPPRRSADAIARPVQPALRDALATLNRLADRR